MVGFLEGYIEDVAKDQKQQAKDGDKILKGLSNTLREGHHFDQAPGGITGLFENLRANTQALGNLHLDTSNNLTGQVLPMFQRLHSEIKDKSKALQSGAGKSSKAVEASRSATQKHIELLGHHTASFDSSGGRAEARNDPYVLHRQIYYRLNKQINDENNNKADILAVQNSFQQFEAHVITSVQAAMNSYQQFMSGQADRQKAMYGDIASTAQNIPLDFEWNGFVKRNGHILVSPNTPSRTIETASFPNQNHRATQPVLEGTLERKHRGMGGIGGYTSGHYVITPMSYLHEYKDTDNFRKDPTPELSLYLPDCTVGALDGTKFVIKGKDSSGGKMSLKSTMTSEIQFKAPTPGEAEKWHSIISGFATASPASTTISPVETRTDQDTYDKPTPNTDAGQQQGVVGTSNADGRSPVPATAAADNKEKETGKVTRTRSSTPPTSATASTNEATLQGTENEEPQSATSNKSGGFLSKFKKAS